MNIFLKARNTDHNDDWRTYRNQKYRVDNLNKANKNNYYNFNLNIDKNDQPGDQKFNNQVNDKSMWKMVINLTNVNKQTPPRVLNYKSKIKTSIKEICNITNSHYAQKFEILGTISKS